MEIYSFFAHVDTPQTKELKKKTREGLGCLIVGKR